MHLPQFGQRLSAPEGRVLPTWLTERSPLYELLMVHMGSKNSPEEDCDVPTWPKNFVQGGCHVTTYLDT